MKLFLNLLWNGDKTISAPICPFIILNNFRTLLENNVHLHSYIVTSIHDSCNVCENALHNIIIYIYREIEKLYCIHNIGIGYLATVQYKEFSRVLHD